MKKYFGVAPSTRNRLLLATAGAATLAVPIVAGMLTAPRLQAQAPQTQSLAVPQWQTAAGGKMVFDVASVKLDTTNYPAHTNINLSGLEDSPPDGGVLSASFPLSGYILFAYKLTPNQIRLLTPQLPEWAAVEQYEIQAQARGNPTRDQMRLMMQSLLADRFKLAVHMETHPLSVFGLALVNPGKPGPQLIPHTDSPPCAPASSPAQDDGWPAPVCGALNFQFSSGRVRTASRNITMEWVAGLLVVAARGAMDRPIVDRTGLSGSVDFRIEFTPESGGVPPDFQPDKTGPTFLQALREQLGLKLEPQTAPVDVLVIDHVEQPPEK